MLSKMLKKISKIERNMYKMAYKFKNGCKQEVSAYEQCNQSLIPCKLIYNDIVVFEAINWVKSQPLKYVLIKRDIEQLINEINGRELNA